LRIKVQAGALRDAVEQVRATTEPGNPAFAGLYFEASHKDGVGRVRLFTMKPGSKTLMAVAAEVEEEGKIVVRPDQILSGLKGHEADALVAFNISPKIKRLNGTCCGSRFAAVLLKGSDDMSAQIAHLPINGTNGSRYSATILADVIKKSAWCAAMSTQSQNVVDALEFKRTDFGFKVLATDGRIAVRVQANTDLAPEEMTIPRVALETFAKLLGKHSADEVHVIKGQPANGEYSELYFRFASIFFGASTSAQRLPNIEPIFNDEMRQPTRVVILSRNILQAMLGRIAGFADRDNPIIHFQLADEKLTLSTGSTDGNIDEELAIAYAGDSKFKTGEGDVSVAYQYVQKILSSVSNDSITLGLRDETSPLVIADKGNDDVNVEYMVACVRPAVIAKTQIDKAVEDDAAVASDATAEVPGEDPVPAAAEPAVKPKATRKKKPEVVETPADPAVAAAETLSPAALVEAAEQAQELNAEEEDDDPFADLEDEVVGGLVAEEAIAHEEQDDSVPV
jgi:DNA polymerase III sliding clamp (beta) subunit (PCNA family)